MNRKDTLPHLTVSYTDVVLMTEFSSAMNDAFAQLYVASCDSGEKLERIAQLVGYIDDLHDGVKEAAQFKHWRRELIAAEQNKHYRSKHTRRDWKHRDLKREQREKKHGKHKRR